MSNIFKDFFVKEKPVFTGITRGVGGFGFGFGGGGEVAPSGPFSASGGEANGITPGNGWTYHTFKTSGSLVISGAAAAKNAEFLIVGGGGSGGLANNNGSDGGAGGGAGNVNSYSNFTTADLGDGTYNIVVGDGAPAYPHSAGSPGSTVQAPQVGDDSTVTKSGPGATLTAKGGGGGAHGPYGGPLGPHGDGGSGGGGGGGGGADGAHKGQPIKNTPQPLLSGVGGVTITQRGNEGGYGNPVPYYGGGGGGAGGAGTPGANSPDPNRGKGGAAFQVPGFTGPETGVSALNPYNGYYGGGGPGGAGGPGDHPANQAPANGSTPNSPATTGPRVGGSAAANTGGGGGGASGAPSPPNPMSPSGAGGSGIVVFRYQA